MRLSGFSFCKNAGNLYYPVVESIKSALPIVDEFIVAVGDSDDNTRELIQSIGSSKIKIIDSVWDMESFPNGTIHAQQTDLAKSHCSGDWLLYLQADEVIHEKDHNKIRAACERFLNDQRVDGFLFPYYHFWGDYDHYQRGHSWYDKEIRIVRNDPEIHSWQSAQSFRRILDFDGFSYRSKHGTSKLNVVELNSHVYHYGWVRPPDLMMKKVNKIFEIHTGIKNRLQGPFTWGKLHKTKSFNDEHPAVMQDRIRNMHWSVNQSEEPGFMRHKRFTSRLMTYIEDWVFGGKKIFGHHNYKRVSSADQK